MDLKEVKKQALDKFIEACEHPCNWTQTNIHEYACKPFSFRAVDVCVMLKTTWCIWVYIDGVKLIYVEDPYDPVWRAAMLVKNDIKERKQKEEDRKECQQILSALRSI